MTRRLAVMEEQLGGNNKNKVGNLNDAVSSSFEYLRLQDCLTVEENVDVRLGRVSG
jgi:hypothetical protein